MRDGTERGWMRCVITQREDRQSASLWDAVSTRHSQNTLALHFDTNLS